LFQAPKAPRGGVVHAGDWMSSDNGHSVPTFRRGEIGLQLAPSWPPQMPARQGPDQNAPKTPRPKMPTTPCQRFPRWRRPLVQTRTSRTAPAWPPAAATTFKAPLQSANQGKARPRLPIMRSPGHTQHQRHCGCRPRNRTSRTDAGSSRSSLPYRINCKNHDRIHHRAVHPEKAPPDSGARRGCHICTVCRRPRPRPRLRLLGYRQDGFCTVTGVNSTVAPSIHAIPTTSPCRVTARIDREGSTNNPA